MSSNRAIPLVDLNEFVHGDEASRAQFVKDLGYAFENIGFVGVVNHGISKELVAGFYAGAKSFFSLPVDIKKNMKCQVSLDKEDILLLEKNMRNKVV